MRGRSCPYALDVRILRRAAGLVGWGALALFSWGCLHDRSIDLTITVTAFEKTAYQLRCDPTGGSLPRAAQSVTHLLNIEISS